MFGLAYKMVLSQLECQSDSQIHVHFSRDGGRFKPLAVQITTVVLTRASVLSHWHVALFSVLASSLIVSVYMPILHVNHMQI